MSKYFYRILHIPTASFLIHSYEPRKAGFRLVEFSSLIRAKKYLKDFIFDYRIHFMSFEEVANNFLKQYDEISFYAFREKLPKIVLSRKEFEILRFEQVCETVKDI